jgi:hypothetical protein
MRSIRQLGSFAALLLQLLPALADDVITNVMSPIVSYQYPENLNSAALINGGILSPLVSYQYFEWPTNGILNLEYSPTVSYFWQSGIVSAPAYLHG